MLGRAIPCARKRTVEGKEAEGEKESKKLIEFHRGLVYPSLPPSLLRIHTWVLPTVCGDAEGLRVYRWYREIRAHRWKRTEFVYKCVYMCVRARVYFRVEPAAYLRRPLSM